MTTTFAPPKPYQARRESDGTYTILDVEVFGCVAENAHGTNPEVDDKFLLDCLTRYRARAAEGYTPPLHIQHHGFGEQVERAGEFRLKRVQMTTYEGRNEPILWADFVRIPEHVFRRIETGEIPYRSVEVDYDDREIQSIALLSHDAPYFKFRNLTVRLSDGAGVAGYSALPDGIGLFAYRPHEEPRMSTSDTDTNAAPTFVTPEDLEKALTSQAETLTTAFAAKLDEAIATFGKKGGKMTDDEDEDDTDKMMDGEEDDEDEDKEKMKKGKMSHDSFASLNGRIVALEQKARDAERAAQARDLFSAAIKDLAEFRLDDQTKTEIEKFAAKGKDELDAFVGAIKRTLPKDPPATLDAAIGTGHQDDAVISRFAAQGADALTAARRADAVYQQQKQYLKTPREKFIEREVERALKGEE